MHLTACTSGFGAFGSAAASFDRSSAGSPPSTTYTKTNLWHAHCTSVPAS